MTRLLALGALLALAASPQFVTAQTPAPSAQRTELQQPGAARPTPAPRKLPVFRHPDVDAAWGAAQRTGRPVMVFVTAADCFFCKKMVSETLSHPQIAHANNQRFETTVLSKEKQPKLVEKLGVKAFPTTLVVNPDGSLAGRVRGFVEPSEWVAQVYTPKKGPRQAAQPTSPTRRPATTR